MAPVTSALYCGFYVNLHMQAVMLIERGKRRMRPKEYWQDICLYTFKMIQVIFNDGMSTETIIHIKGGTLLTEDRRDIL